MTRFVYREARLPGLAFLFPGQGSQHVGMARELAEAYPAARAALEEADAVLGFELSRLCFQGPEDRLTDTVNAQPALLAASVAALAALQSELGALPVPGLVAGHSLGEYTALVATNSMAYPDGLLLVRERGRLMKEAGERAPGMMAAVLGLDEPTVAEICAQAAEATGGVVQVANDNCPGQVVVSGDRATLERAMQALSQAGARKVVPLAVSIAAHSPLMVPAAERLAAAIRATPIHAPVAPVLANTTAEPLAEPGALRQELVAQLTGSVRWTASMQRALALGIDTFAEIGPGNVLTGLVKRIHRKARRFNVADPQGVQALAEWIRERLGR